MQKNANNQIVQAEDRLLVLELTPEYLHTLDEETDHILNELGQPSIRSHIGDIFQDTGLRYEGYIFKAQAVGSAFTINISRPKTRGKEFNVFYSVKDLMEKTWQDNEKLPNPIIEALNILYDKLIFPHILDFKRVLDGRKTLTPINFMQFSRGRINKALPVAVVYCNRNKRNMSIMFCKEVCTCFDHQDINQNIFCKVLTEIK